jgi:UDP-N-acetylglucosamine 4,6-dehydratase/5-epimerase
MQIKKKLFKNKSILVTGGTGSFGQYFTETILKDFAPRKIIIFSRDELKQFEMAEKLKKYNKKLRFFIGDIRDLPRLKIAMKDVDIVIHAAALKQVETAEYNPFEVVKTNVLGTQNVVDAIHESNVKIAIALSTDKAAAPINLYGATKLTADKLFISANNYIPDKCFSVVRYGNVMMSRGSVIPIFKRQKSSGVINITDKDMTRFSLTLSEGVEFVIKCLSNMWGGELFVPKIPSYNILDLARAVAPRCKINFTGTRPGEKIHEDLVTNSDSLQTIEFKNYYIILSSAKNQEKITLNDFINNFDSEKGKLCERDFSYNSQNNKDFLSVKELSILIKKNS